MNENNAEKSIKSCQRSRGNDFHFLFSLRNWSNAKLNVDFSWDGKGIEAPIDVDKISRFFLNLKI